MTKEEFLELAHREAAERCTCDPKPENILSVLDQCRG